MRKKICRIILPIGMTVLFFYCASKQSMGAGKIDNSMKNETELYSEDGRETPETEILETEILETEASGSETVQAELSGTENTETEVPETEITEIELTEEQKAELSTHYGTYRITQFCPTIYYSKETGVNEMSEQEVDMMLGRIVEIEPERLLTYNWENGLAGRGGRDYFINYSVERYTLDSPKYGWWSVEDMKTSDVQRIWALEPDCYMEGAVGSENFDQIDGVITTPQLSEPYGDQEFYTLADKNKLILHSELIPDSYFLLERCQEEPKEDHVKWEEREVRELLKEIYGAYQVTKFLPTKFFPITGYYDEELLSQDEADMTIGRTVSISEDLFVTYDNWWWLNWNRPWVAEAEVKNPDYRVKTVWADEIYGIRDGMLPDDLAQQEYVEIDVYPGFVSHERTLPQMYLVNDGRIILCAMGQYFLLERAEDKKAITHEKDLSEWLGRYVYIEGNSAYHIEIRKESPGEYEAEIEADIDRVTESEYVEKWYTRVKADVSGNSERISFTLKDYLEGDRRWNIGTVLLRFKKDAETGDVYTYWGKLDSHIMNLDTHDKEAGRICFVKE